jgi:ectoine hydroxylase-related dioxygenase (phytanoyl-CoA dioxygenase family)
MPSPLDLDTPYELTDEQITRFRVDGFIKLKEVLSPEVLAFYGDEITTKVHELNQEDTPLEERGTYAKAFLQVMNIWRHSAVVDTFVRSRRLARIASELLGTKGVRMYHDQALYKEAGGGYTPWHVDQFYWPLGNEKTVTAWIPLDAVPMENGPLEFSKGSQKIHFGREFAISDESEVEIEKNLRRSQLPVISESFDLGEVSFHYGYTFHRAGPNTSNRPRRVMTIIYMDSEMRLIQPKNKNQQADWDGWCPGAKVGEVIATELNPLLYDSGSAGN